MKQDHDYKKFQDRVFQEMQDMNLMDDQTAVGQLLEQYMTAYGLTLDDVDDILKKGFNGVNPKNGQEFLELMKAAMKK